MSQPNDARLILLHKQKTSGRVRFLCYPHGVLSPAPLPTLSALRPSDYTPKIQPHPSALLRAAALAFGLDEDAIEAEAEFAVWVDTPSGDVPILLGCFATVDPPMAEAAAHEGRFIALTECRHLPEIERDLLRLAYEQVLG